MLSRCREVSSQFRTRTRSIRVSLGSEYRVRLYFMCLLVNDRLNARMSLYEIQYEVEAPDQSSVLLPLPIVPSYQCWALSWELEICTANSLWDLPCSFFFFLPETPIEYSTDDIIMCFLPPLFYIYTRLGNSWNLRTWRATRSGRILYQEWE